MDAKSYKLELLKILRENSAQARDKLKAIESSIPPNTRGIQIGIHPNQEPDGMFSVVVHLDGPDLHVLNQAIQNHRFLFDVKFAGSSIIPDVPTFEPYDTDFEVNDVIVDSSIIWLEEIWGSLSGELSRFPTLAVGDEGYGTTSPRNLNP